MWENGVVKYDKILKTSVSSLDLILNIQPSIGRLYSTNYTKDRKPQIIQSDLDGNNARIIQNNLSIICPSSPSLLDMSNLVDMKINDMNSKNTLIYWLCNSHFYAFGKSLQSYPPTRCLIPDKRIYNVEKPTYTVTTNSIIVNLPEPVLKNGCKKHNLPTTLYTIYINYCLNNKLNKFDNFTMQPYKRYCEIQNLMPLTEYKLLLVISNFYTDQLSMDPLFRSEVILRTKPSKLDAPENVTVQALTPTLAAVYWMPSKNLNCVPVIYEVYWAFIINSTRQINELPINKTEHKVGSKFFTIIEPLIPGQKYRVFVRIYPANFSDHYNDSLSKTLYMYSEPNNITLSEVSINGMNISWIPSVNMVHYLLEYKNVEMQEWQIKNNFEPNNGGKVMYYIKNLLPGTIYEFRLILKYPKYEKNFIWPSDKRFTFSTLTSKPMKIL
ncbi:protein sevenless-like [Formica exsecta]|uniref:protein sevenless-like n=1 Tax=Formica exsecta TaxID=72781 RepID=UPI0011436F01|nr:protein sevenless-like [Formica exsecta]